MQEYHVGKIFSCKKFLLRGKNSWEIKIYGCRNIVNGEKNPQDIIIIILLSIFIMIMKIAMIIIKNMLKKKLPAKKT